MSERERDCYTQKSSETSHKVYLYSSKLECREAIMKHNTFPLMVRFKIAGNTLFSNKLKNSIKRFNIWINVR